MLSAQLHVAEGRGLALLGEGNATRRAIREAERHYECSRSGEEPPSLRFYTDDSLAADIGRCLRDIGEPDCAAKLLGQAMDGVESWQIRARGFFQTDLASTHLANRDLEQAAALGRDAVRTAAKVDSTLTLDRLRTLQRQVQPLRASSPHPDELDKRIADLLTRTRNRRDEDSTT